DFDSTSQYIRGKDSTGVGVDTTSGDATSINGETQFILESESGYDRRILNSFVDSTSYSPSLVYEDNPGLSVDGSWTGWDPSVGGSYSSNNQLTFHFNDQAALFVIYQDGTAIDPGFSYSIDRTSINIFHNSDTSTYSYQDYSTVGGMKTVIASMNGLATVGNLIFDGLNSESFKLASGPITPDATVYPALRASFASYQTISDKMLADRTNFASDRSSSDSSRVIYLLNTREDQIKQNVQAEELLNTSDCSSGDLYAWADNRFNRGDGCEARLDQITKQIARNQSALRISKRLIG
ncbi:MAG: hypothetical protein ACTSRU_13495, partial [Candidatus Hodarchaeales archaeon]